MSDSAFSWIHSYDAIASALLVCQVRQGELCEIVHNTIGECYEAMTFSFFSMFNGKRRNRERHIEVVKKSLEPSGKTSGYRLIPRASCSPDRRSSCVRTTGTASCNPCTTSGTLHTCNLRTSVVTSRDLNKTSAKLGIAANRH